MNDTLRQLQQALAGKPDKPPKGFQTVEQWAKEWNRSTAHVGTLLSRAVKAKLWERRAFYIITGRGLYPVPHYRKR